MDIMNFPDGFRPQGSDFLKREQNKLDEFIRLRQNFGKGVVQGLQLTRQNDGSVTLSAGHGNDALGNAIVEATAQTLDLSGIAMPASSKYKWLAVLLEYKQKQEGQAKGAASGTWAQKLDAYTVKYIEGTESDSEATAQKPVNNTNALRVGDILFDDNGTRSANNSLADKNLSDTFDALEVLLKAYADQAESDAITAASGKDTALETKLNTAIATAKNAAISAANSHANTQDNSHDTSLQTWVKNYIRTNVFPVGSFFLTAVNKNPATFIGGTWEAQDAKNRYLCTSTGNSTSNMDTEALLNIKGGWTNGAAVYAHVGGFGGAFQSSRFRAGQADGTTASSNGFSFDASRTDSPNNANNAIYGRNTKTSTRGAIRPQTIYLGLWKRTA